MKAKKPDCTIKINIRTYTNGGKYPQVSGLLHHEELHTSHAEHSGIVRRLSHYFSSFVPKQRYRRFRTITLSLRPPLFQACITPLVALKFSIHPQRVSLCTPQNVSYLTTNFNCKHFSSVTCRCNRANDKANPCNKERQNFHSNFDCRDCAGDGDDETSSDEEDRLGREMRKVRR